ncbi:MAG: hypothetical protein KDE58_40575, partial [Caldilineaceae bacterium]|nr:hypothetical protein [Caldilineaceae bacterium]
MLATLFAVLLCGTHNIASTFSQDGGLSVQAYLNWTIDPDGRVVDVLFGEDVALTAPLDRFRFAIDIVQPLARDSGAILGDLTGDGAADLLLATFDGVKLFYPGVQGKPTTFGNGIYLKHATTAADQDPFYDEEQSAYWVTGDIGDLDGDGQQEIVIGREIFSNEGTAQEPMLSSKFLLGSASNFDPAASLGDLNHDGKLDVVVSFGNDRTSYAKRSWIFWNQSTPGALQFSEQLLYEWPI